MVILFALGIAFLIPPLFLIFIKSRDLYGTGKYWFVIASMAWGAVAYLIAAQINPAMIDMGLPRNMVIRVTGPILEEILKSFVLVYIILRADFNYVVDGAVYGFAAGIGFAIIENYEYVMGNPEIAVTVAVARVFSTNLIHASGSGVIGVALALWRGEKSSRSWFWVLGGYVFSSIFHMGFNTMVSTGAPVLVFAVVFGMAGLVMIYYAIRRGLNFQKEFIATQLNDVTRVSESEVRALNQIETIDRLLKPLAAQFGREKADKVKILMSKQAELAIKTQLLGSTVNEDKKQDMMEIIKGLQNDMQVLREEIGFYCMLYVRQVYLPQDMNLWGAISNRIAAASTGQKGGGLWDRAASRVQSSKPQGENRE